ncbi:MAG: hypothetical protein ACI4UX_00200 [Clostridia bacterium]
MTIIVMLILVGVTVTVAINGGLFNTAKEAAKKTNNAKIFEQIQMAVVVARKTDEEDILPELTDLVEVMHEVEDDEYEYYNEKLPIIRGECDNDIIGAYASCAGVSRDYMKEIIDNILIELGMEVTEENARSITLQMLGEETGKTTEAEIIDFLKNQTIEEIKQNTFSGQQLQILDKNKLLEELGNIDGIESIREKGNTIEVQYEYSSIRGYNISRDWLVIVEYGDQQVIITGEGEIIGPNKKITSADEDPSVGDITDGSKRTGTIGDPYLIASIEDLVAFSNSVNAGNTYEGKYIELAFDLDFEDSKSYKNAEDTSFEDLNGDGTVEGIKAELTNKEGKGFTPIGSYDETKKETITFNGNFDGNYKKLKNIYINDVLVYLASGKNPVTGVEWSCWCPCDTALFRYTKNATIENLGLEGGTIKSSSYKIAYEKGEESYKDYLDEGIEGYIVASIVGVGEETTIKRCYANLTLGKAERVSGVASKAENIIECYNASNLEGNIVSGITGYCSKIINCYNKGNLTGIDVASGIRR